LDRPDNEHLTTGRVAPGFCGLLSGDDLAKGRTLAVTGRNSGKAVRGGDVQNRQNRLRGAMPV